MRKWEFSEFCHTHSQTHTHTLFGHYFNLQEMIWAVLFTQDYLQLKGECARSISVSFLLDLFVSCQLCFYVYYGNLLFSSPPLSHASAPTLRTPLLCCRCRCTQFNFTVLLQREGREGKGGGRYCEVEGKEKGKSTPMRGEQIPDGLLFLSLKDIIIVAWCSSAYQDMAWIFFSASGSSSVE